MIYIIWIEFKDCYMYMCNNLVLLKCERYILEVVYDDKGFVCFYC